MTKVVRQFIGIPRSLIRRHLKNLTGAELKVLLLSYDQATTNFSWAVSFAEQVILKLGLTSEEIQTACQSLEKKRLISHFWTDQQGNTILYNFALIRPPRRPRLTDKTRPRFAGPGQLRNITKRPQ